MTLISSILKTSSSQDRSLTVFPGGLEHLVPQVNRYTFTDLLARGGIFLSERLWDQKPRPHDFPIRNRIIMGLSQSLIVIEAQARSGTMRTAQLALDAGRDLYLLKHEKTNFFNPQGSISLSEDGAFVFDKIDQLLEALASTYMN